jgi:two-component system, chemotaxis family, protein-glutamate methylesterase/glutaminase
MAPRPRVLVVDDSVVVRKIVTDVLAEDPGLEVVGTAPNGRIALAKIPQLNPDLVTLDVEMPELDGVATLKAIRASYPRLPVIMFSTLTERGAAVTMEALLAGANDYVTKPANVGSVPEAMQRIRQDLIPRIHALCGRAPATRGLAPQAAPVVAAGRPDRRIGGRRGPAPRIDAVVIGVSTGGPNALAALLPELPADLPVPVLVVQHMPPMFTRLLAERLDAHCALEVTEAVDGDEVRPGRVLIAPGDRHLVLRRRGPAVVAGLDSGPPENSCRPSADVLFRSATTVYGGHLLGLVLTGMGYDGRRGSEHLASLGARVLVQDEATSVVWGMPGAVVQSGLADEVLPLDRLAGAIVDRVRRSRSGTTCAPLPVEVPAAAPSGAARATAASPTAASPTTAPPRAVPSWREGRR